MLSRANHERRHRNTIDFTQKKSLKRDRAARTSTPTSESPPEESRSAKRRRLVQYKSAPRAAQAMKPSTEGTPSSKSGTIEQKVNKCHLLALPPELRNQIWRLCLVQEKPIDVHNQFKEVFAHTGHARMSVPSRVPPAYPDPRKEELTPAIESNSCFALLSCNKQMYKEAGDIAYGENTFNTDNPSSMLQFVEVIGDSALSLTHITMGNMKGLGNERFWLSPPSKVIESRTTQLRGLLNILTKVPHFKRIDFECNNVDDATTEATTNGHRTKVSAYMHLEKSVLNRTQYLRNQRLYKLIHLMQHDDDACLACISASGPDTRSKIKPCAKDCLKLGLPLDTDETEETKPIEQKDVTGFNEDQYSDDEESYDEEEEDDDEDEDSYGGRIDFGDSEDEDVGEDC